MITHEEALNEITEKLNKSWGNQPKSWWNVRLNAIRTQQEKVSKLLGLYKERARIDNDISIARTKEERDILRVSWWRNHDEINELEASLNENL